MKILLTMKTLTRKNLKVTNIYLVPFIINQQLIVCCIYKKHDNDNKECSSSDDERNEYDRPPKH